MSSCAFRRSLVYFWSMPSGAADFVKSLSKLLVAMRFLARIKTNQVLIFLHGIDVSTPPAFFFLQLA